MDNYIESELVTFNGHRFVRNKKSKEISSLWREDICIARKDFTHLEEVAAKELVKGGR